VSWERFLSLYFRPKFRDLDELIKLLTSDNESTTSRAFWLHARCRLGSPTRSRSYIARAGRDLILPTKLSTNNLTESVSPTQELFQSTRRRNFGLGRSSVAYKGASATALGSLVGRRQGSYEIGNVARSAQVGAGRGG
jgi:hypothetical protein